MSLLDEDLVEQEDFALAYAARNWVQQHSWPSTLKKSISFSISFIKKEIFSAVKLVPIKNKVYLFPYYKYPILLDISAKNNIPDYIDLSKCQVYYYDLYSYFKK